VLYSQNTCMKKLASGLYLVLALSVLAMAGCKTSRKGTIGKNNAVPTNTTNNDSTGTSPQAKLTPSPVPNTRPNPIPNPQPPSPPM
jgi:hypothetical protein